MLEMLRKASTTWVAKLLLILLVLSFAVWGVSGAMLGGADDTVVAVGDTKVDMRQFRFAYDQQVNRFSNQIGKRLNRDEARSLGVEGSVIAQMVTGAVLDENAKKMGLGLSEEKLAALIGDDPAFKDASGNFSRSQLNQALRNVGLREEDYITNRESVAIRGQIVDAITSNLTVPQAFADALTLHENEERSITYAVIGKTDVKPPETPSDDVAMKYYEANMAKYKAPQYRKISYVHLTPELISDPAAIDDAEIADEYEASISQFSTPEEREVHQLVFTDKTKAEEAEAAIKGGKSFAEVAKDMGKTEKDTSLGMLKQADFPDKNLAESAFKLQEGASSEIIDGMFGPVILFVSKIEAETTKPLEEVKDQIRKDLALKEAEKTVFDAHDTYEDERAAGATMQEAAQKAGAEVKTIEAIDRRGLDKQAKPITGLPDSTNLIAGAFETNEGDENAPLNIGSAGFVWYEVTGIEDERQKPFEEVKDQVIADWTEVETLNEVDKLANTIADKIRNGEDFNAVTSELLPSTAIETKVNVEDSTKDSQADNEQDTTKVAGAAAKVSRALPLNNMKRSAAGGAIGPEAIEGIFSTTKDEVIVSAASDPAKRLVIRIEKVEAGSDALSDAKILEQFNSSIQDDLLGEMVTDLREKSELTINRNAINTALSM